MRLIKFIKAKDWMVFFGLAISLTLHSARANEVDYPSKPISIIVAYAPGGQGDAFARIISDRLGQIYKQSVVVDNRPGVSGVVGTRLAAKAKNDGYTLFLGQTGEIVVNRVIMKDMGFDPVKDFIPVVLIGNAPLVLLVSSDSPLTSVNELVELAKSKPGRLSFGSVGAGTPGHLAATALSLGIKSEMVHVPYKGVGPLMADLMSQRLDFFFSSASAAMPQVKGGKLKALAVSTPHRMNSLPQLPTLAETVFPGFNYSLWGGLFAPSGTPKNVIQSLNKEINQILALPEIKAQMDRDSLAVPSNTPQEFTNYIATESVKFEKLVTDAKLKLDN
ncbi:MAG: Bug family tripartite tricarboxylate transporter substrate binding protein [Burkholderiaceae bacterium]